MLEKKITQIEYFYKDIPQRDSLYRQYQRGEYLAYSPPWEFQHK